MLFGLVRGDAIIRILVVKIVRVVKREIFFCNRQLIRTNQFGTFGVNRFAINRISTSKLVREIGLSPKTVFVHQADSNRSQTVFFSIKTPFVEKGYSVL